LFHAPRQAGEPMDRVAPARANSPDFMPASKQSCASKSIEIHTLELTFRPLPD
jgi:hypothetical protein